MSRDDLELQIQERYKDKVTPEHKMALDGVLMTHLMLTIHRETYEAFLAAERHMHNVGGLINPTLYRDMLYSKSFTTQKKLVDAALQFLRAVDDIKDEFIKGVP